MVQAHSPELAVHPVEVESGLGAHLYAADAEGGGMEVGEGAVSVLVLDVYPGIGGVKLRGLREPQAELVYGDFLIEDGNASLSGGLLRSREALYGGDEPSVGIADNGDRATVSSVVMPSISVRMLTEASSRDGSSSVVM